MVDLNGLYTPQDAINTCEESLQCAGFTYKGNLSKTSPVQQNFTQQMCLIEIFRSFKFYAFQRQEI